MTAVVLPVQEERDAGKQPLPERMQVVVDLRTEVLTSSYAQRRANVWLGMNVGNLLLIEHPELLLGDALQWRFDIILSVPQHNQPGPVTQQRIGQIRLDALTGEVLDPVELVEELMAHAGALATR